MKQTSDWMNERPDKDILFSKTVKAGKRVYYFDVKRDRRDALYMSITESKRVRDGKPDERPVFEKHKIFLYREDMERFLAALTAAADYAIVNSPTPDGDAPYPEGEGWSGKPEDYFAAVDRGDQEGYEDYRYNDSPETSGMTDGKIKIDLDF